MTALFSRARAYLPLSPAERAILKLVEGLLCVGVVAALPVVADALGRQSVNWSDVSHTALAAASVAVLLALAKYAKAQGAPALATTLHTAAAGLSTATGLSDPDAGPVAPPSVADGTAPIQPDPASSAPRAEGSAG